VGFATITFCVVSQQVFVAVVVVVNFIIDSVWKLLDTPLVDGGVCPGCLKPTEISPCTH
jgi:hypothetical protein